MSASCALSIDFKGTQEEFDAYMEYSEQIATAGLNEITDGVIVPSPYDEACEHCKYLGICGYNEESDERTRKIEDLEKEDILRAIGKSVKTKSEGEEE